MISTYRVPAQRTSGASYIQEELVRDRIHGLREEAETAREVRRLVALRRAHRRAERARSRLRRAILLAG
ncbi:hypothetical protein D5H75_12135 [Bailinhaonella thermotolerans]|uniref:Uncharacterized protein n=1 Tax=Bailinhaonella thermotolerans TaxID=1070861 RepID=A0A3A4BG92_9ACTN|nr:hypothetical protein D5H75_12135 [Bailinhaonella thermotolerans]